MAFLSPCSQSACSRSTHGDAKRGKWRFSLLDGKLDIQEYNVYHNMGSWYLGVGAFVRKNGNKNEFGLGISFTIQQTGDYMPVKFL